MTNRDTVTCPACRETFPDVASSRAVKVHYWQKHTDYSTAVKKFGYKMIVLDSPAIAVLVGLLLYFRPTDYFLLYIIAGYVIYAGTILLISILGLRSYKRRWAEEHNTQQML